jgi:hypothetical protein
VSNVDARGEQARIEAQRMFRRVLASWASDALALRRAGLDRPSYRLAGAPAQPLLRKAA